jgi:hypothetical protein
VEQAASIVTITNPTNRHIMTLILLEALGAGIALVLIVWWTMFSGRRGGELPDDAEQDHETRKFVKNSKKF